MAAVFIPPSPQTSFNMSTRRPLANVPNATNSPHRTGLVPAKRPRSLAPFDIPYGQPPPKKHLAEVDGDARSPTRTRSTQQSADSKLFSRRSNNGQPSAFEKKLVAARDRDRQAQPRGTRQEKPSAETVDSIRQWQRHYRKAFPQFVFYFDSVPEEVRGKCSRQVIALGAVSSTPAVQNFTLREVGILQTFDIYSSALGIQALLFYSTDDWFSARKNSFLV